MSYDFQKYSTSAHGRYHVKYHIVLATKYRARALEPIADTVKQTLYEIADESEFRIVAMAVEADHVHLIVSSHPGIAVLDIIKRLKQVSTYRLWTQCADELSKFFWKKKIVWTKGYFVSTLGCISEETAIQYVKNQGL